MRLLIFNPRQSFRFTLENSRKKFRWHFAFVSCKKKCSLSFAPHQNEGFKTEIRFLRILFSFYGLYNFHSLFLSLSLKFNGVAKIQQVPYLILTQLCVLNYFKNQFSTECVKILFSVFSTEIENYVEFGSREK